MSNDCIVSPSAKQIVLNFIDAMNAHDVNIAKTYLAKDFVRFGVDVNWQGMPRNEYLGLWDNYAQPFPDLYWNVQTVIAEGGEVAVSMIETGTMTGEWHLRGKVIQPNQKSY